jgi:hypothetical protein
MDKQVQKKVVKPFKPVNVAITDWNEYDQEAKRLSKEFGVPVYVPAVLRKAFTVYKETISK